MKDVKDTVSLVDRMSKVELQVQELAKGGMYLAEAGMKIDERIEATFRLESRDGEVEENQ